MKKVNWGILSTANIGKTQTIPAMLMADNCNLYGIASRDRSKAEEFQKEFGFEKTYGSYEELLEDSNIEAVYIPLPNNLHGKWIKEAAKKGKHILCEKPIVSSEEELKEVLDVCNENGVILMEAFAYLHSPIIKEIKQVIDSGEIGEVVFMETTFIVPKLDESNIRMNRALLGGGLYDLGCYPISLILTLIGEEPIDVKAIADFAKTGVDDYANVFLKFNDNKRANVLCGMCSSARRDGFFVYGTKGVIEAPVSYNALGDLNYHVVKDNETITRKVQVPNNYQLEIEQMGRCITDGERPWVSNEFSLLNARVLDSALDSMGYRN